MDGWSDSGAVAVTDPADSATSGAGPVRATVGRIVEYVQVGQRRVAVIAGVSFLFWLVVELAENLGIWPLVVAVGLFAYLYVQETAKETLAASAYGTGVLAVGVGLFLLYQSVAGGSTEPLVDAVVRVSGWPLAGVALVAVGALFRRVEL